MKAQMVSKILCVLLLFTLAACTLPEVTPVTTDTQEPTSSFNTTAEVTTPSEVSPQNAAVINSGNAAALAVTGKVAITSPQVLGWAKDSQSLAVVNQTADANGSSLALRPSQFHRLLQNMSTAPRDSASLPLPLMGTPPL